MATKKSQSISAQLIRGAYTSARSGGYQKSNFNLDFSGIEKALNAQAAIVEQQKARMEEALDFQPALGKVGKQDQGPLLDYFSNVKNQMADIHNEMQGADQETRIKLQGELARLKQTAVTANETLTQRSQISEDFANSIKDISGSMDPYRMEQLNKLHVEKDYTPIIQDGEIAYQLPDGSVLTNKEANDFKLKAYDQQKKINDFANKFHTTGFQNKALTPDTINATRQDLMKDLDKDAIASLKTDKLLAGYDLILDDEREYAAINEKYGTKYKVGDELPDEHERYGIANNIVTQLQSVHKSGQGEYDKQKEENKRDNLPIFEFGAKDMIAGRDKNRYYWDSKEKVYVEKKWDPAAINDMGDNDPKNDTPGAYVPTGTKIKDAETMNQFMVSPKYQLKNI